MLHKLSVYIYITLSIFITLFQNYSHHTINLLNVTNWASIFHISFYYNVLYVYMWGPCFGKKVGGIWHISTPFTNASYNSLSTTTLHTSLYIYIVNHFPSPLPSHFSYTNNFFFSPPSTITTITTTITDMSDKKCSHHKSKKKKLIRRICAGVLIFLFLALLTILIVWAVLHPKKPRFILQDTTIFTFNVSAPNIFSTSIQTTIYARNPNSKIGIYYDSMHVYATYHNQQITYYTQIPQVYQGHKDVNIWSPFVYGNNIPIAPYNGPGLSEDQQNGGVWLDFKIDGRVKWKVGSITTGHYHLHVTCSAYVPLGDRPGYGGVMVGNNAVKYQLARDCSVSVWNNDRQVCLDQFSFLI